MPTLQRTIDPEEYVVRSGPRDTPVTYRVTAEGERFLRLVLGLREGMEFADSDLQWLVDRGWAILVPESAPGAEVSTARGLAAAPPAEGSGGPRGKAGREAGARHEGGRSTLTRRTRGREVALQVLYQIEQNPGVDPAQLDQFLVRRLRDEKLIAFTRMLVDGVREHQKALDAMISELAENWRIDRMAAIDRNILRLGAFELLHCTDVPRSVAINEALELAKRYSTAQSSRFVNGILDRVHPGSEGPGVSTDETQVGGEVLEARSGVSEHQGPSQPADFGASEDQGPSDPAEGG
jgi:N utilization substance protein B